MSTVIYNANILTFGETEKPAQAVFVNDETVVLVGENEEVKSLISGKVKGENLNEKFVLPAMCETNLFSLENFCGEPKNSKFSLLSEKNASSKAKEQKDCNFKAAKSFFEEYQDECIKSGVTTIWCKIKSEKEFKLWEKFSEKNIIKIDVIGLIDFVLAKSVMDENCRSYRKYKNGFRLGGYVVSVDGDIASKRAWLSKPYKHSRGFSGFKNIVEEQLIFIIKTALEEKKQIVFEANGDMSVSEIIRCYDLATEGKEVDDNFKMLIETSGLVSDAQIKELAIRGIGVKLNLNFVTYNFDLAKKLMGRTRLKQMINIKRFFSNDLKFTFAKTNESIFEMASLLAGEGETKLSKIFKKQNLNKYKILKKIINNDAYFSFEGEQKGTIENGKKANFVLFDKNPLLSNSNKSPTKVFLNGKELKLKK